VCIRSPEGVVCGITRLPANLLTHTVTQSAKRALAKYTQEPADKLIGNKQMYLDLVTAPTHSVHAAQLPTQQLSTP
jgi:hypothetical protein